MEEILQQALDLSNTMTSEEHAALLGDTKDLKIYTFTSHEWQNYCKGDYYFVAQDRNQAWQFAKAFECEHNNACDNNSAYTIRFENEPCEHEIKPGFLPLNRT